MKKIISLITTLLMIGMVFGSGTRAVAAETEDAQARFSCGTLGIDCFVGGISDLQGGKIVISYNPEVVEFETSGGDVYWQEGYDVSEAGKLVVTFQDVVGMTQQGVTKSFYPTLYFQCVGNGTPDYRIESVEVYRADGRTEAVNAEAEYEEVSLLCAPLWHYDQENGVLAIEGNGYLAMHTASEEDTGAAEWEEYASRIRTLVLSEGITGVHSGSFRELTALEKIEIADSVKTIQAGAFSENQDGKAVEVVGAPMSAVEKFAGNQEGFQFVPDRTFMKGDIDLNGEYSADDALAILKMVVRLEPMYSYSADANGDNTVTAEDALYVLKKVVKLI